jgi:hypothetical protein
MGFGSEMLAAENQKELLMSDDNYLAKGIHQLTDIHIAGPNKHGNFVIYRKATRQGIIMSGMELVELHRVLDTKRALEDWEALYIQDNSGPAIKERYNNLDLTLFTWSETDHNKSP